MPGEYHPGSNSRRQSASLVGETIGNREAHEKQVIAEELDREVRTTMHLINAQFKLHQMQIERGTFYFQWVHCEPAFTRDPTRPIQKLLYLVYCRDLVVYDRFKSLIKLPQRNVEYRRDVLTQHFYEQILDHARLKVREADHTSFCSCQIQIDLQPKVRPMIQ